MGLYLQSVGRRHKPETGFAQKITVNHCRTLYSSDYILICLMVSCPFIETPFWEHLCKIKKKQKQNITKIKKKQNKTAHVLYYDLILSKTHQI